MARVSMVAPPSYIWVTQIKGEDGILRKFRGEFKTQEEFMHQVKLWWSNNVDEYEASTLHIDMISNAGIKLDVGDDSIILR